jgi:hypothetical protein
VRLIRYLAQRWDDYQRERRIRAYAHAVCAELKAGRRQLAIEAWQALRAEVFDRSPAQIARMERGRGVRA